MAGRKADTKEAEQIYEQFGKLRRGIKDILAGRAAEMGLNGTQYAVIREIRAKPGTTLHGLSEKLGLPKSTLSRIVDGLVQNGNVNREVPEGNRRTVMLSLTAATLSRLAVKDELIAELAAGISAAEARNIIKALAALNRLLEKRK